MRHAIAMSELSEEALFDLLTRLSQMKTRSIDLLERWSASAKDGDVKAGLSGQLADERRHLRLITDEVKRRGGRLPSTVDHVVTKAFAMVQAQPNDTMKVCAFHRGVVYSTNQRCYRLMMLVDEAATALLEEIVQDEERHLRWADIRLRSLSGQEVRACNEMLQKLNGNIDAVWLRPWRHLSQSRLSYLG
jgi:rubrerythrin